MGEPDLFIYTNMTRSGSPNISGNYLIRLRAQRKYNILAIIIVVCFMAISTPAAAATYYYAS